MMQKHILQGSGDNKRVQIGVGDVAAAGITASMSEQASDTQSRNEISPYLSGESRRRALPAGLGLARRRGLRLVHFRRGIIMMACDAHHATLAARVPPATLTAFDTVDLT